MIDTVIYATLFNAIWQAALLGGGAWAIIQIFGVNSASIRAFLWSAAFLAAAFAPVIAFAPDISVDRQFIAIGTGGDGAALPVASEQFTSAIASGPSRVVPYKAVLALFLAFLWLVGSGMHFARLMKESAAVAKMRRESEPISPLDTVATLPKFVSLHANESITSPVATGLVRPVIILPVSMATKLETPVVKSVVAHELAHIRRGDLVLNFVEALILCLFWWNPLLHRMRAAVAEAREMACDDHAVETARDAHIYAATLVDCAERALVAPYQRRLRGALGVTGEPATLSRRITRLLSENYAAVSRTSPWRILLAAIASISVFTGVAVATPRMAIPIDWAAGARLPADGRSEAEQLGRYLVTAVLESDRAGAETLLSAGADINAILEGDGTPLIAAVNTGSLDFAKWLIERGANVDAYALYDETALISAVRHGNRDMVRLLLDAGADAELSARTEDGTIRSPLSEAQRLSHRRIAAMLRDAGATE